MTSHVLKLVKGPFNFLTRLYNEHKQNADFEARSRAASESILRCFNSSYEDPRPLLGLINLVSSDEALPPEHRVRALSFAGKDEDNVYLRLMHGREDQRFDPQARAQLIEAFHKGGVYPLYFEQMIYRRMSGGLGAGMSYCVRQRSLMHALARQYNKTARGRNDVQMSLPSEDVALAPFELAVQAIIARCGVHDAAHILAGRRYLAISGEVGEFFGVPDASVYSLLNEPARCKLRSMLGLKDQAALDDLLKKEKPPQQASSKASKPPSSPAC